MDSTQLAAFNDIFTGIYVVLTLIIAGAAIWSIQVTSKQSRNAITASENQSKEAIAAMREQIVASEQQTQEALYNQHKPIVVPVGALYTRKDAFEMRNAGNGIALNTWGVLTSVSTNKFYRFESTHFLIPDKAQEIGLWEISNSLDFMFSTREFNGYSIYPPPDTAKIGTDMRLMVTYNDLFGNTYLGVYDHSEFGWRQVGEIKRIEQRLDDYLEEKRSEFYQNQQEAGSHN